jgi:hypothetical protein
MDVPRALAQIAAIHDHMAKGEVYRGYRSLPVAASGAIGLGAAWLQPRELSTSDPLGYVLYWTVVAACAALVGASEIGWNYVLHEDVAARRRTQRVVGQFLPSLAGAAIVTASFVHLGLGLVTLLPGIWAICFGIGAFASRPYLPRATGYVALFYYAAGVALLWTAASPAPLAGWRVGGTFGAGQMLAAMVLYWNLERPSGAEIQDHEEEGD